jgi:cytochrome b involved in lipid metabolism
MAPREQGQKQVQNTGGTPDAPSAPNAPSPSGATTALTMAEIAKHNTAQDCWLLISGKIYDVTKFIPSHPGGSIIIKSCGTDATQAFDTKGGKGRGHSPRAESMLAQYYIGDLNQSVSSGALQQAQQSAAANTPAGGGGGDNDKESENETEDD